MVGPGCTPDQVVDHGKESVINSDVDLSDMATLSTSTLSSSSSRMQLQSPSQAPLSKHPCRRRATNAAEILRKIPAIQEGYQTENENETMDGSKMQIQSQSLPLALPLKPRALTRGEELVIEQSFESYNGPAGFKQLLIITAKCEVTETYANTSLTEVLDVLNKTAMEIPQLETKQQGIVLPTAVEKGPERFYLRWKEQEDRLLLLHLWMTDSIASSNNGFNTISKDPLTMTRLKNTFVASPRSRPQIQNGHTSLYDSVSHHQMSQPPFNSNERKAIYARGIIKGFKHDLENVGIYFVDFGDQQWVEFNSLRTLPKEIANIDPLCFPAYLVNFQLTDEEKQLQSAVNCAFDKIMNLNDVSSDHCTTVTTNNVDNRSVSQQQQQHPKSESELFCLIRTIKRSQVGPGFGESDSSGEQYGVELWCNNTVNGVQSQLNVCEELRKSYPKKKKTVKFNIPDSPKAKNAAVLEAHQNANQRYSDDEVNVKPYKEVDFRTLKQYRVLEIISPGEFQLEIIPSEEKVRRWKRGFQAQYDLETGRTLFGIKNGKVSNNRCYAWLDSKDKSWNRVRIISPSFSKPKMFKVLDIDRGQIVYAKLGDLWELNPDYCIFPALALRAHLVHIQPRDGADKWSKDSILHFKSLCQPDKIFNGLTLELVDRDFPANPYANAEGKIVSYGIVLAENSDGYFGTVQSALVRAQVVDATGPATGAHNLAYSDGNFSLPYYKREDMEKVLDIKLDLEESLPKKKILSLTFHMPAFNKASEKVDKIPQALRSKMAGMKITFAGTGPSNFYIRMDNRQDEFSEMTKDLEVVVSELEVVPFAHLKPGLFAIARALDNVTYNYWARVMIVTVDPTLATAIFIDYGYIVPINLDTIRDIPQYFNKIPSFCHRVHLDLAEVNDTVDVLKYNDVKEKALIPSGSTKWTKQANEAWKRYINIWQRYESAYHCWQGQRSSVVPLEEFNQDLFFNQESLSWVSAKPMKKGDYAIINQNSEHTLLRQFYSSIGISLVYELRAENLCEFFSFKSMLTFLEKVGFVCHPTFD